MSKFVFVLICALSLASSTHAELAEHLAFGVQQNSLPSALKCEPIYPETKMDDTGQYVCKTLPGVSSTYEQYIVAFVNDFGICNVTAVTPYIDDDRRGDATRSVFQQLLSGMTKIYGQPDEQVDHTNSAADAAPEAFKEAIIYDNRQVFDQWSSLASVSPDLEGASLVISGSDELGLAVYSVVRFKGNDLCIQRLKADIGVGTE